MAGFIDWTIVDAGIQSYILGSSLHIQCFDNIVGRTLLSLILVPTNLPIRYIFDHRSETAV